MSQSKTFSNLFSLLIYYLIIINKIKHFQLGPSLIPLGLDFIKLPLPLILALSDNVDIFKYQIQSIAYLGNDAFVTGSITGRLTLLVK